MLLPGNLKNDYAKATLYEWSKKHDFVTAPGKSCPLDYETWDKRLDERFYAKVQILFESQTPESQKPFN
jgi:hypothetical protein